MTGNLDAVRFVQFAEPHAWLQTADRLHGQAVALRADAGKGLVSFIDHHAGGAVQSWASTNKACFLLAGFALENAIKAFLVYENPGWISNGNLSRRLRSHDLRELQEASTLVPYRTRLLWVLDGFEEGLDSWARYPCGLSVDRSLPEAVMTPRLWAGYLRLMSAYGRRLKMLLCREWRGPHGTRRRWKIEGDLLGV